MTAGGKVRRATLSDDGELGAWQTLGALPAGVDVLYSTARVTAGRLDAFYAELPASGDGIALAGAPIANGTLGAWQHTTWLTGFRGHPQYAFATVDASLGGGSYVYALGGYVSNDAGNEVVADGAAAALDAAGIPGESFAVRPLPTPRSFGQAVAVDDWLFVIGGKDSVFSGAGSADVIAAKIGAGGALDAWTPVAALPAGRTSHSVAASGDFLYVTGGGLDAGGLDTVFSARVRSPVR
jgi:Kelch motif protein